MINEIDNTKFKYHDDIKLEIAKIISFNLKKKKNKTKIRNNKFTEFIEWLEINNIKFNRHCKNFFKLGLGNLTREDVLHLYSNYNKNKFIIGDKVKKANGKPFKNGEDIQIIMGFTINLNDPKKRKAVIFYDESICNTDQLVKL